VHVLPSPKVTILSCITRWPLADSVRSTHDANETPSTREHMTAKPASPVHAVISRMLWMRLCCLEQVHTTSPGLSESIQPQRSCMTTLYQTLVQRASYKSRNFCAAARRNVSRSD